MHRCPHCRASVEAEARFCGECGGVLLGSSADATFGDQAPTLGEPELAGPHGGSGQPATGDLIGREVIGQYVIRGRLGAGGMGEVYVADQPAIGRRVAIKVLHPQLTRGADTRRRFQQEAQAAARLHSPHIVQIFNYGEMADGTLFMAMELLDGRTVAELIRAEAPLDPARAVKLVRQCCEALADAHAAGVVHRDLKPSNLMLVARGGDPEFVKVLDFGVARLDGGGVTQDGALLGTPQYMSPEQLRSEPLDGRSDLYALGLILYELLGGRPPFSAQTPIGYVHLHLNEPPPAITERVPGLAPALADAVMRALAKDREQRPPSAGVWAASLAAALGQRPAAEQALTEPGGASPVAPVAPGGGAVVSSAASPRPAPVVPIVAGVVAVVGLLGLGLWGYRTLMTDADLSRAPTAADETSGAGPLTRETGAGETGASETSGETGASEDGGSEAEPRDTHGGEPDPIVPQAPEPVGEPRAVDLSPESAELLALSVAELEARLDALLDETLLPPSTRDQVREAFEMQKAMTAAGPDGDKQLKLTLIQYIRAYQNPQVRAKPGDKLSRAELERIFLAMPMSQDLDQDMRKTVLNQALRAYAGYEPAGDVEFLQRLAIASMIRAMATDPDIIDGPRPRE